MSKQKDKPPVIRESIEVKHQFTTEEYRERTSELTRAMEQVEEKEAQMKADAAKNKAVIKELQARVRELRNQLQAGCETRLTDALVEFNRKKGEKSYYFNSPGKPEHKSFIRKEAMTEKDYEKLPLDEGDEATKKPEAAAPAAVSPVENTVTAPASPA